jgi:hypothetical protein
MVPGGYLAPAPAHRVAGGVAPPPWGLVKNRVPSPPMPPHRPPYGARLSSPPLPLPPRGGGSVRLVAKKCCWGWVGVGGGFWVGGLGLGFAPPPLVGGGCGVFPRPPPPPCAPPFPPPQFTHFPVPRVLPPPFLPPPPAPPGPRPPHHPGGGCCAHYKIRGGLPPGGGGGGPKSGKKLPGVGGGLWGGPWGPPWKNKCCCAVWAPRVGIHRGGDW